MSGLTAHQGTFIRGGDDDDRTGETFWPQIVLDELARLAATFADEADDDDIRTGIACQHGQQRRLADARAGENAHALAPAAGQKSVQGAHAKVDLVAHALALMGRWRLAAQGIGVSATRQIAFTIDRTTKGIDHPSQPFVARVDGGRRILDNHARAHADRVDRAEWHGKRPVFGKTHDFRQGLAAVTADEAHARADADHALHARDLHHQALHGDNPGEAGSRGHAGDFGDQGLQCAAPGIAGEHTVDLAPPTLNLR